MDPTKQDSAAANVDDRTRSAAVERPDFEFFTLGLFRFSSLRIDSDRRQRLDDPYRDGGRWRVETEGSSSE
jgi:hypothetical protein